MQSWMWGVIAGVPVLAVGAAYAMGAFSTNIPAVDQQIRETTEAKTAFNGDNEYYGGRRKKTTKTKTKSKHKKTNRRK